MTERVTRQHDLLHASLHEHSNELSNEMRGLRSREEKALVEGSGPSPDREPANGTADGGREAHERQTGKANVREKVLVHHASSGKAVVQRYGVACLAAYALMSFMGKSFTGKDGIERNIFRWFDVALASIIAYWLIQAAI